MLTLDAVAGKTKMVLVLLLVGVTATSIVFIVYGFSGNSKQTTAFNDLPQDLDAISNWINLVSLCSTHSGCIALQLSVREFSSIILMCLSSHDAFIAYD